MLTPRKNSLLGAHEAAHEADAPLPNAIIEQLDIIGAAQHAAQEAQVGGHTVVPPRCVRVPPSHAAHARCLTASDGHPFAPGDRCSVRASSADFCACMCAQAVVSMATDSRGHRATGRQGFEPPASSATRSQ